MFGLADDLPQHEKSAHHPRSPYATAKSFAHHTAVNFRESYGINVSTAILFNHESPLRPRKFVTRKITSAVAAIALGLQETVTLGNLEVRRDWGAAVDYVEAMRLAIEAEPADDYCIATGVSHSLAELIEVAFAAADLPQGMDRVARDSTLERPADVKETLGDPSKAESRLGWSPRWSFEETVAEMVRVDIERIRTGVEHDVAYLARRSRLGSSA
jgi:GDPmannose 4,6-dehydratase